MLSILAAIVISFGNGTRPRGFKFAEVQFEGDNGLFQLQQEIRYDRSKSVEDLETAKVKLGKGVTLRELGMALNNLSVIETVGPDEDDAGEVVAIGNMSQKDALKLVGSLGADSLSKLKEDEAASKNRPKVLKAIEARLSELNGEADEWKSLEIKLLDLTPESIELLSGAGLVTIGDVQQKVDENDGVLPIDGFTDEMFSALINEIKKQAA